MVLELIIIGGAVYYFVQKNKQQKAKKAAFAANQPFRNRDGSVTYPPGYPGLPPYEYMPTTGSYDYKIQVPIEVEDRRERGAYFDSIPVHESRGEKAPLIVETREVTNEKV